MKKLIYVFTGFILILGAVLIIRTMSYPFVKTYSGADEIQISDDFKKQIQRFQAGIQIPTVSRDSQQFERFIKYLKSSYPTLSFQTINQHALVYQWKGKSPSLKPILFLSHYDVVPAGENNLWREEAFSGKILEGKIYGRGTLDMKSMLFSLMDAREILESEKFTPERDIYFAFGHDEEIGGNEGAQKIAEYFKEKNIEFEAIYDEGGIVTGPGVAGLTRDIALIGVAEKGYTSIVIKVKGEGGHSSMPPRQTALGRAAIIMQRLEENQMKADLIDPIQDFLNNLASESSSITKLAVANQWLLKPILLNKFSKEGPSNALIRTTTALTMSKGSEADNVLPNTAEIVVNFRILPGNSVEDVKKHVAKLCEGFEVEMHSLSDREPSRISPKETMGYEVLVQTIQKYFPQAMVSSYVTIAGTDSSKYEIVGKNIYRFLPVRLTNDERGGIHNANESLSVDSYKKMILFFKEMIKAF